MLRRVLSSGRLPFVAAAVSIVLAAPSLWAGWGVDDNWHRGLVLRPAVLEEAGILKSNLLMDGFTFIDGDPVRSHRLMDLGALPWWTDPELRGAFWRPVSALTHWVDYTFWPTHPLLMHAHSLLWAAVLVGCAATAYRKLMGATWVAGAAAVMFAVDDARGTPIGFLANRNALIAGVFGILAVMAHHRWRSRGRAVWGIAAPILTGVSILSGEIGVAVLAYIIAYAVFLDRAAWRSRLFAVAPYFVVVLSWRIVWSRLGYGVSAGMEFYIDPAVEPLRFATQLVFRMPILVAGQWFVSVDLALLFKTFAPSAMPALWLFSVVACGVLAAVVLPVIRRDATARYWAGGMVLSLIPISAAFPSDRLLVFVSFGAFGLLGQCFSAVRKRAADAGTASDSPLLRRRWCRGLVYFFAVRQLILAPILLPLRAGNPLGPKSMIKAMSVDMSFGDSVVTQDVIIVDAPVAMIAGLLPIDRALADRPVPRHTRVLSASGVPATLRRVDDRTLVVRPDGGYLKWPLDQLFRGDRRPFSLGELVELSGVTITISELTDDGRPAEATFRFDVSLDDESLVWLHWSDAEGRFMEINPPRVGESVRL